MAKTKSDEKKGAADGVLTVELPICALTERTAVVATHINVKISQEEGEALACILSQMMKENAELKSGRVINAHGRALRAALRIIYDNMAA